MGTRVPRRIGDPAPGSLSPLEMLPVHTSGGRGRSSGSWRRPDLSLEDHANPTGFSGHTASSDSLQPSLFRRGSSLPLRPRTWMRQTWLVAAACLLPGSRHTCAGSLPPCLDHGHVLGLLCSLHGADSALQTTPAQAMSISDLWPVHGLRHCQYYLCNSCTSFRTPPADRSGLECICQP